MAILKSTKTCNLLYPAPQKKGGSWPIMCTRECTANNRSPGNALADGRERPQKNAQALVEKKYWPAPEREDANAMSLDEMGL